MNRALIGLLAFTVGCGSNVEGSNPQANIPSQAKFILLVKRRLAKVKMQRDKVLLSQKRLEERRQHALRQLRDAGITSSKDLAKVTGWRVLAMEIKQIVSLLQDVKRKLSSCNDAIFKLEALLRKIDLQRQLDGSKNSEAQLDELAAITFETNDALGLSPTMPEDFALEELLNNQLIGTGEGANSNGR